MFHQPFRLRSLIGLQLLLIVSASLGCAASSNTLDCADIAAEYRAACPEDTEGDVLDTLQFCEGANALGSPPGCRAAARALRSCVAADWGGLLGVLCGDALLDSACVVEEEALADCIASADEPDEPADEVGEPYETCSEPLDCPDEAPRCDRVVSSWDDGTSASALICTRYCDYDSDCPFGNGDPGICLFRDGAARCFETCFGDSDCDPGFACASSGGDFFCMPL